MLPSPLPLKGSLPVEPLLNIALRAGRYAGKAILRSMDRVDTLLVEEKGHNDLVSEVDRLAEDRVVETIRKFYPQHRIIGEEYGVQEGGADTEYTWIVDPLDGTTNFLRGIPHFCTAIAVRRGSILAHGAIIDHVRGEEFTATRGAGAYLNGRRIRVSPHSDLDGSVIAGGLPHAQVAAHLETYSSIHKSFTQRCRTTRRHGSAALDLAYVAAGRVDGFFEMGLKIWDIAAGALLVREAGGLVGDAAGGERFLDTGNVVAASPKLFRSMLRVVRAASRDDEKLTGGCH